MTIELDSTLAQAEVLFLSFAQLVADMDRRAADDKARSSSTVRRRNTAHDGTTGEKLDVKPTPKQPVLSDDLRGLLVAGR